MRIQKEVERRRREAINEGINRLKDIVPNADKNNKGSILQAAATYISDLKAAEQQNIEKWTLEKLLIDQSFEAANGDRDELRHKLDALELQKRILMKAVEALGGSVVDEPDEGSSTFACFLDDGVSYV